MALPTDDLFLSYASEDDAFADSLARTLRSIGVSVFRAGDQLKAGDSIVSRFVRLATRAGGS